MSRKRTYRVELGPTALELELSSRERAHLAKPLEPHGTEREVRVLVAGSEPLVLVGDRVVALELGSGERRTVSRRGRHADVRVLGGARGASPGPRAGSQEKTLRAPMPGRVVAVHVRAGDEVAAGAPLVVVEAMKMQNELLSPCAGSVRAVPVNEGDAVERGAVLVELA